MNDQTIEPGFAQGFPRIDQSRWRGLAQAALKGKPFETLVSRAPDGFDIQPLYARLAEDRPRPWRANAGAWRVVARADDVDPARANAQMRDDLANGARAVELIFDGSATAYGFGLPAGRNALDTALEGIDFSARDHIAFDLCGASFDHARDFADVLAARRADPSVVDARFGLDPFARMALNGGATPWETIGPAFAAACQSLAARGWTRGLAVADGRIAHNAGATPARELAYVVAAALACVRALESAGVALHDARAMLGFRLSVDADEFAGIAKLRALRRLWARVESACELTPAPIHIHAETSWRMLTRRDPWTNILRGTIACVAAGLGGADSIATLPFTLALGLPDAFARRVARNTQLVLIEEANLGRVADPAAGSGAFEALTDALCERAWAMLREIDATGGLAASLARGDVQREVAASRDARQKAYAERAASIVGVTAFPDTGERPVTILSPAPPPARTAPGAFAPMRDAEPFDIV